MRELAASRVLLVLLLFLAGCRGNIQDSADAGGDASGEDGASFGDDGAVWGDDGEAPGDDASVTGDDPAPADDTPETRLLDSVTDHGVTWTFSRAVPVGRFVTGEYYVMGPVTVASIHPPPGNGRNGSVLNLPPTPILRPPLFPFSPSFRLNQWEERGRNRLLERGPSRFNRAFSRTPERVGLGRLRLRQKPMPVVTSLYGIRRQETCPEKELFKFPQVPARHLPQPNNPRRTRSTNHILRRSSQNAKKLRTKSLRARVSRGG